MLTATQLERYADTLLWGLQTARAERYKKGDIIMIRYDRAALPLAEVLYPRLLEKGFNVLQRTTLTEKMEQDFYRLSDANQLVFKVPGDQELFGALNGGIYLRAPSSITHLSSADPGKIGKAAVARKYLSDILDVREAQGLFGWTLCICPTEELARHAGMTLEEYTDQIVKACFLNRTDPVSHWKKIYKEAQAIKKWLNSLKVKFFKIESENIDLEIFPGEFRKWIGISGHNIPSFELFLSPDWRGTSGVYYADQPTYRSGNYAKGIRLEFRNGSAVSVEAQEGRDFVQKQLTMDEGASKIGEFSLTDKRFSKIDRFMANTLYDENYGGKSGNCHIALGASYSDTFDGNPAELTKEKKARLGFNDSALHWDLVNTEEKRVVAHLETGEKKTIYEKGMFTC
ncbi:MAG: Aminopeptidase T [Deltaproteobacteria bacterium ADurb.BinA179]|jgi:aminopeptidase|nr:aminopeptidase [Deltaproteobacteria bacterium]MDI9543961.1 aminopeptidase [Pseudomonadota bacterium]OPZ29280.1 MAG: Aminopeptidase T [Deltaproteobacteria bacterium ADurb.BinA179]HRR21971.1 aminopeptidase [Desulfomonilia bacterium]HNR50691.1 aminopeptidase [Deltaproteobacteria bacterium]